MGSPAASPGPQSPMSPQSPLGVTLAQEPKSPKSSPSDGSSDSDALQVTAVTRPNVTRKVVSESFSEDIARQMFDETVERKENNYGKELNAQLVRSTYNGIAYVNEMADKEAKKRYKKEMKARKKAKKARKALKKMAEKEGAG